jgi:hypothetical protein
VVLRIALRPTLCHEHEQQRGARQDERQCLVDVAHNRVFWPDRKRDRAAASTEGIACRRLRAVRVADLAAAIRRISPSVPAAPTPAASQSNRSLDGSAGVDAMLV